MIRGPGVGIYGEMDEAALAINRGHQFLHEIALAVNTILVVSIREELATFVAGSLQSDPTPFLGNQAILYAAGDSGK